MKFFVDSADINEIKKAKKLGLADGVTTNPTLIMKSGGDFKKTIMEITDSIEGPVAVEPVSKDLKGILDEGEKYANWAENVTVKIPVTTPGLQAVRELNARGISTTVTLIFSSTQALLAAKAGAEFICPFVGRLDDISHSGMDLISEIVSIYNNYPDITTEVIVASIRNPNHILDSALMGADGVTIPYKVMEKLTRHPLTDIGIEKFLKDWEKINS
ncbi:MAG: fructose-6-phosphate aldolase [bacterium]